MNTAIIIACSLVAIGCLYLARRRDPDDLASGTLTDQVSAAHDVPAALPWPAKHFLVVCSHCCRVTGSDGQPVRVGDELRVSHGICPDCAREWEEEAARLTSAATVQTA